MISCAKLSTALAAALCAPALLSQSAPFRVGVCTHFSQNKGLLPVNLSLIREAGVASIRDEAPWRSLEREKGRLAMLPMYEEYVNAAIRAGVEPLIILDYGNPFYDGGDKPISAEAREGFARYSEFLVQHFKDRVKLWEIWNEWDIGIGGTTPGSPETYVALLQTVYPRLKKIAPSITVYGGAMTPGGVQGRWLEGMLKAGGLNYLDELSLHTYIYSATGRERTPEHWAEWMGRVQALVKQSSGGREIPMVITEMGWPTQVDRRGTPPEVAAAYLARMYLLARTLPYIRGLWWYDFQDDGWRHSYNEHNFGLVRPDGTPKPAYFALKDVAEVAGRAEFVERVATDDPDIYLLKFRASGSEVWALWSAHEDDDWQITLRSSDAEPRPVEIRLVGAGVVTRPWGSRDWADSKRPETRPSELTLALRQTPWLIRGNLSNVRVAAVQRREFPELRRGAVTLR